jgi:adenylate kinase
MNASSHSKAAVILLGPPGAGKGTQADKLAKQFSFLKIATSAIIHEKIRASADDPATHRAKQDIEQGRLIDPTLIARWVIEAIQNFARKNASIVFDGSFRTLYEAEVEFPILRKEYGENIFVFLIKISDEQTLFRNSHRRVCADCKQPVLYSKETDQLHTCPECGGYLIRRPDDVPEVIKKRLEEYHTRTEPVIAFFESQWRVLAIDGEQSPDKVYKDIEAYLSDI